MVAYSFQKQFAEPILAETKQQTIRAFGKRRHARVGDELQLYVGMRTKHCRLIMRAKCIADPTVRLDFVNDSVDIITSAGRTIASDCALDLFAKRDGFVSWDHLRAFWAKHHSGVTVFEGICIRWESVAW